MRPLSARPSDAASSRMLALSACIHGICILALIICSASFHKAEPQQPQAIPRVRIETPPASPPKTELLQPEMVAEPTPVAENQIHVAEKPKPEETKQAEVVAKTEKEATKSIPISKRKKPMRTVKAPKPPEKKPDKTAEAKSDKKKRPEPKKKKEDPDEHLARRLADLRKEVENKKSDAVAPRPKPKPSNPAVGDGTQPGSGLVDKRLLEWYAAVRVKINANWSVFTSYHNSDRVTEVGVQLAEDGRLINATLDKASGDEVLDRAALRAVYQASPFPRMPAEVAERIRQAGGLALQFTVRGIQ